MGLDMYLSAVRHLSKFDKNVALHKKLDKATKEVKFCGNIDTIEIKKEVGYWRKANHIHKWFVDNVQDGKDECESNCVSREKLKELKALCLEALKAENKGKVLPTQSGFFFGSIDYDEGYLADCRETIKIIDTVLKIPEEWDFEYQSSW